MPVLKRRTPTGAAIHFNGNLSLVAGYRRLYKKAPLNENHLTQLSFLPVDIDWSLQSKVPILDIQMKPPISYEEYKTSDYEPNLRTIRPKSIEFEESFLLFDAWFRACKLDSGKKLCIMTHNWPELQHLLINWLGFHTYQQYFETRYARDLISICSFLNDLAVHRDEYPIFAKVAKLSRILIDLDIYNREMPDSLAIARLTQQAYRQLVYFTNSLLFYPVNDLVEQVTEAKNQNGDILPLPIVSEMTEAMHNDIERQRTEIENEDLESDDEI